MTGENCNWQDHQDIQRWMEDWREEVRHKTLAFVGKDDSVDEVRHRLAHGDFSGKNEISVKSFLAELDAKVHRVSDQAKADREERAIDAAERSADAAQRSAKWSGWAILISVVALLLAAWPYMRALVD